MVASWVARFTTRSIVLLLILAMFGIMVLLSMAVHDLRAQEADTRLIACSSQNGLRLVVDPSECRGNETSVEWNISGPPGPPGPQGPAGSSQVSLHLSDLPPVSETRAAFIKFEGIDGESRASGFENWSDLISFDHHFQLPIHSGAGGAGSPVLEDIVVVKELDKASPLIADRGLKGQIIPRVQISLTDLDADGNRRAYNEIELKNVRVSSYGVGGSGQSDVLPSESISLNFEEIKVTYTEMDDNGKPLGTTEYQFNRQTGAS